MDNRSLDFGYIVDKTMGVITSRLVELVILGLIFVALPYVLLSMLSTQWVTQSAETGMINFNFSFGAFLLSILVGLLPYVLQASIIHTTVSKLTGRSTSVGESIGVALGVLLPVFITALLMSIGIGIGFVLLIVPGLILLTIWIVTIPVLVMEKAGIFGSFGRSVQLTEGNRWQIFGLLVLAWVVGIVAGLVFGLLTAGVAMTNPTQDYSFIGSVLGAIFNTAVYIISAVGVSVLYVHLRELKGEAGADAMAEMFG